jgi:hypothetical protein
LGNGFGWPSEQDLVLFNTADSNFKNHIVERRCTYSHFSVFNILGGVQVGASEKLRHSASQNISETRQENFVDNKESSNDDMEDAGAEMTASSAGEAVRRLPDIFLQYACCLFDSAPKFPFKQFIEDVLSESFPQNVI